MSYFDDASLVMIPSGYKDQKVYSVKPIDGSGDLTFSRASSATRVNSSGLLEKVRTNLTLYSEQFDNAAWSKPLLTLSANAGTSPNGTTTADLIYPSANTTNAAIFNGITISSGVEYTNSVYAKASGKTWVFIRGINDGIGAFFNLSTGVVGTVQSGVTATITSIGSGWYRCSVTQTSTSTTGRLVILIVDGDASTAVTANGTDGLLIWGGQQEAGVMTDYIGPTAGTSVSVGPVSGLPRLDYSGGASCPSLLLEPQRTNLVTYSEQFDNAEWTKTRASVTANAATSPDGHTNADKLVEDATASSTHFLQLDFITVTATNYTATIYAKAAERSQVRILLTNYWSSGNEAIYDLSAGTVVSVGAGAVSASITDVGNGWYRCALVSGTAIAGPNAKVDVMPAVAGSASYTGDGTSGILIYGAQLEAGAYATSYIGPTYSAAVTRVVDKTLTSGLSGSLPQTAGTLFWDIEYTYGASSTMLMHNTGVSDYAFCQVSAGGLVEGGIYESGTMVERLAKSSPIATGRHKLAFAYETNSFALYVDGVLADSGTSGSTASISMNTISLDWNSTDFTRVNQVVLFQTRLSNASLASLTTL